MKKLFLSLTVIASSFAFAQSVGFGVKGGINVSSMDNEGQEQWIDDESSKVGYYAGVFVNVPIGSNFSIQPEVLYNNLGQKTDYKITGNNVVTAKNNIDYISIPLMAQYNIAQGLYLEAGPQFSFLVNQKYNVSGVNSTISNAVESIINSTNSKDNYKKFDLGIGIGAGYKIYKNIGINARYVAGVTNDSETDAIKFKNNAFHAGVSVGF